MNSKKYKIFFIVACDLLLMGFLLFLEKFYIDSAFSIDRFIILSSIIIFISLHFLLNVRKLYDFIFNKRYIIALIIFIFSVFNKYHFSSIGMFNRYIEPNIYVSNSEPFLGIPRGIRSDEWMVSTPTILSQQYVNYSKYNDLLNDKENNVVLFPRLPVKDISILANPTSIGYLFLDVERGLSFSSIGALLLLFFSSFELCMIITKKNRLYSLLGGLMITFAPAVQWWSGIVYITYGQLAIVLINKFFESSSSIIKFIISLAIGVVGAAYTLAIYPAWQIPFGYLYLALLIWIIIKERKNLKWKYLLYLIPFLIVYIGLVIPPLIESKEIIEITTNTVYPGARDSTGGTGWRLLFLYFSSLLYSFRDVLNPSEFSQFISFFPIPIIFSVFYFIRSIVKKKCDIFLISVCIVAIVLMIWNFIPISNIIAKLSLLYMSTPERSQLVIGYACILLMIRNMGIYESDSAISMKHVIVSGFISIFTCLFGMTIVTKFINGIMPSFFTPLVSYVLYSLFLVLFIFIIFNNKKTNKIFAIIVIIITLISGTTVNPISRGLTVVYNKPLAKEIRKINSLNSDLTWISVGTFVDSNYLVANGAETINSTNYYPNLKLWNQLDQNNLYNDVYNRYAHVIMQFSNTETTFTLVSNDVIQVNLSYEDTCKLGVDYVVAGDELDNVENNILMFNKIYDGDGLNIFEIVCH